MSNRERLFLIGRDPLSGAAKPRWNAGNDPAVPDWMGADPNHIQRALERAMSRNGGGWLVLGDRERLKNATKTEPQKLTVLGQELVLWQKPSTETFYLAPNRCPHMGAQLCDGFSVTRVSAEGEIICPWHALALQGDRPRGIFRPYTLWDDGVLLWARFDRELGEAATDRPIQTQRPLSGLSAVMELDARCEPMDVVANRLDPWHGVHFHNHSFARLSVLSLDDEQVTVRVAYRIFGKVAMEVDAQFLSPDPRTITMQIIAGEGVGSLVETHALPILSGTHPEGPKTRVIEATIATSERLFASWLPKASWLKPLVKARAERLWQEDRVYAERTYALRMEQSKPGQKVSLPTFANRTS